MKALVLKGIGKMVFLNNPDLVNKNNEKCKGITF